MPTIQTYDLKTLVDNGEDGLEMLGANDEDDVNNLSFFKSASNTSIVTLHRCVLTNQPVGSKTITKMKRWLTNPNHYPEQKKIIA